MAHDYFVGSYFSDKGQISSMLFPFLHFGYRIEFTFGSTILFSVPQKYLYSTNYFIVNPFTRMFRNIGFLRLGERGFFSFLEKCTSQKYEWVLLKHVLKHMDSHFLICSSVDMVWKRTKLPYGGMAPPKESIFYKGKFCWLYSDQDYDDYPTYGYTVYWLDLKRNDWGFSFVPISDL